MKAWHFSNGKLGYDDNRNVEAGKKYTVDGEIILCEFGLHGSLKAIDALYYAPGNIVSWCDFGENVVIGNDKIVSSERTVIWMADAEHVLWEWSRWCALQVIHLWDAPKIVVDYLETSDESLRAALRAAARAAAWASARDASWDVSWAAARDAAWAAQNKRLEEMLKNLEGK